MHPYFSLAGGVALVTGGSRGIGQMIAQGLLEAGARVFICARDAEACRRHRHTPLGSTATARRSPPTFPAEPVPGAWRRRSADSARGWISW
ncbi:SDR family NAD(P)-dependent oxidoreductase [Pseudomonas aeruginosa]